MSGVTVAAVDLGMRVLIRATQPLRRFEPADSAADWDAAARRIYG